jgi:RteC protein
MIEKARQLYTTLKASLDECAGKQTFRIRIAECSHRSAESALLLVQDMMKNYPLTSTAEEIELFKYIIPLFFAEEEFHSLIYHTELIRPSRSPITLRVYLQNELKRLAIFRQANKVFCDYYKDGLKSLDEKYFMRDSEIRGDELAGMLLALERYHAYVQEQIKNNSGTEKNYNLV